MWDGGGSEHLFSKRMGLPRHRRSICSSEIRFWTAGKFVTFTEMRGGVGRSAGSPTTSLEEGTREVFAHKIMDCTVGKFVIF